jgi:hypothetical protein
VAGLESTILRGVNVDLTEREEVKGERKEVHNVHEEEQQNVFCLPIAMKNKSA